MGDASGPRHHGGDDHGPDGAPRHLRPGSPRTPRYVLMYGASDAAHRDPPARGAPAPADPPPAEPVRSAAPVPAGTVPAPAPTTGQGHARPTAAAPGLGPATRGTPGYGPPTGGPHPHAPLADTPRHGVPRYVPTSSPQAGARALAAPASGDAHDRHDDHRGHHRHEDDRGHDDHDRYDDRDYDRDFDDRHGGGAVGSFLRAARAEAMWRYRCAPMWVRITTDVVAASVVLVLIVGISVALRPGDGAPQATVDRSPVSVATTVTTAATTTTSVPPTTTTTVPTTTTTAPPTTTTAPPPVVPPPTEAPAPTVPSTTTTAAVRYRDCAEAGAAGALPLFEGEPGYAPHLDRDGDGEACEWDDRRRG